MARARTIKPGFFTNEALADCSAFARLLFAGLWLVADKEGRLEDRPRKIKAELFPHDPLDCSPLLSELEKAGMIERYEVKEIKYIQVVNFRKHQNPHPKEAVSSIPEKPSNLIKLLVPEIPAPAGPITSSPLPITHSPLSERGCVVRENTTNFSVQIIELFDAERVAAFGDNQARLHPASTDLVFAQRWLEAGATPEICRSVFSSGFGSTKAQGRDPPASLKYFDRPIANAIVEKNRPPTEGKINGNGHAKPGPATGIAAGFAGALSEFNDDSGADIYAAQPLLERQ